MYDDATLFVCTTGMQCMTYLLVVDLIFEAHCCCMSILELVAHQTRWIATALGTQTNAIHHHHTTTSTITLYTLTAKSL